GKTGDGAVQLIDGNAALWISSVSLLVTIFFSVFARGFLKLVPIMAGIVAGYVTALVYGVVDFTAVQQASWLAMPNFTYPEFNINAML
ncbi:solute carrier family 23 protein, partial [Vibrio natriegens]